MYGPSAVRVLALRLLLATHLLIVQTPVRLVVAEDPVARCNARLQTTRRLSRTMTLISLRLANVLPNLRQKYALRNRMTPSEHVVSGRRNPRVRALLRICFEKLPATYLHCATS